MKISIITVVYNNIKTIEQSISSVLGQTYKNVEYIIIDGGSSDGTLKILNRYRPDIDILVSEKDQGIYDAMNKGIKLATGDLVYFLNSDDRFYDEDVLEDVVSIAKRNQTADFFYGGVICKNIFGSDSMNIFLKEISAFSIKMGQNIKHQSLFVRREMFSELGLFETKYKVSADYEWECRLVCASKKGLFMDRIIAYYDQTGFSSKGSWEQYREKCGIINKHFGFPFVQIFYIQSIFKSTIVFILKKINLTGFISRVINKLKGTTLRN